MKRKVRKTRKYPNGIFFSILIFMLLILFTGLFLSFILIGKENINQMSKYTRRYAETIAEGFTYIAEKSYKSRNYKKLNNIFQKKIDEKAVYEAFFVLNNGKIIAHSVEGVKNSLKGNIGNDEFAYNVDLILKPSWTRSKDLFFTEYNIMRKKPPFHREVRQILKNVLYDKINSPGWLVSKAVFVRNKAVGTVNFIISKDMIYNYITMYVKRSAVIFIFLFFIILIFSVLITSKINKNYHEISDYPKVRIKKPVKVKKLKPKKVVHNDIVGVEMLPEYKENIIVKDKGIYSYEEEDDPFFEGLDGFSTGKGGKIRDAIPVSKKR